MTNAQEWQGRVGNTWAEEWRLTDMSFAGLAAPLDAAIAAAAPSSGRALDIGCGAGVTSLALAAARPGLSIVGVDLSEQLVAVARARARGIANLDYRTGNVVDFAEATHGANRFDLAFSRHGVMFFADPAAAFRAIGGAIRPGGALVFSCFAAIARNPWAEEIAVAAGAAAPAPSPDGGYVPGPFAFSDPHFVRELLEQAGFSAPDPQLADYAYRTGEGVDAVERALHFFQRIGPAARLLAAIEPAQRAPVRERLRAFLAERERDGAVTFPAAAWIWTARVKG
ncbi:MAG: methyltransferase domain-containing protein [Sphingomonas sp.]|nr:methyltransferase domain-containing protein [Sphingomonas sp.]